MPARPAPEDREGPPARVIQVPNSPVYDVDREKAPAPASGPEVDASSRSRLTPEMIEVIEQVAVAVVATADAHGECDSSLRAGPPGFVQVLDEGRIAYPEYRGNGVLASLGNIHENPHVGVLLVDFASDRRLHVSGRTRIVADDQLRAEQPSLPVEAVPGRRSDTWVVLEVDQASLQDWGEVPHLEPVERERAWGTDAAVPKGGDFFGVAAQARSAREVREARTAAPRETPATEDPGDRDTERPPEDPGHEDHVRERPECRGPVGPSTWTRDG